MDLKEIEQLGPGQEASHWYYASKARALMQALGDRHPRRILDVGAGSGFFSKMLLRHTSAASAICIDPGYPEDRSETYFTKPIAFCRASQPGEADLVLLIDVLEHVDDDLALLRELTSVAKPGTRFIVSVPAFSWLWSAHDEFLEHRRRYSLNRLLRVMSAAGLASATGFYMFAAIFPAAAAHRLWNRRRAAADVRRSDLRQHHPLTNTILTRLCCAESAVARYNRAFGLTAFAVAEKI